MTGVTEILVAIERGDPSAAEQLLPLVYEELRQLARERMAHEKPGQTLQATALVHEAYLRLVKGSPQQNWDCRGHFFAAAAEAMRRILIETARRKLTVRQGGQSQRQDLLDADVAVDGVDDEALALDEALTRLTGIRPQAAELVKLRFYAGLTVEEAAPIIGISTRQAGRLWHYARAWLRRAMDGTPG